MKDDSDPGKRQQILRAAWQCFAAYGFRKTSMDDIARGAGMSRPALYLHYRNKDDIFRSLVRHYYDTTADALSGVLARDGPPDQVLADAFAAQLGEAIEAMLASPHGMELLDTGMATAADIKTEGEARLTALYAEWLNRAAVNGHVDLVESPEVTAGAITTALRGIKAGGTDVSTARTRLAVLARLLGQGLAARR